MNKIYLTLLLIFLVSTFAKAEMNVPVQLRLKSPGGTYPTENNLSFKLVILTPETGCILREEDFSSQTITNGNISLSLGSGVRGVSDPSLTLNQVYDNSKTKIGLTCVDANNNITLTGQSYIPAGSDGRIIRILTTIGGDPVLANFNMRATPYAIQAESVGGKSASDLIVKDVTSQMNQTNLNDLLLDITRFNNLKNIATTGQAANATNATTAVNFSGNLAGDVSGTQSSTSVNKIKGVSVSGAAPTTGQVLQFDGSQYVPTSLSSGSVVSVAGKSGVVTLVSTDISGFGNSAGLDVGTSAGTVAAGNDSRIVSAYADTLAATASNTASTLVKRDASGNIATTNILSSNNSTNNLYLYDGANSVRIKAPTGLAASYILNLPAGAGTTGQFLQTDGSGNLTWANAGGGGGSVLDVTASAPLASSGGTNPNLTISQASMSSAGFLSSNDWTTFNSKQNALGFTPLDAAFFNSAVASASCSAGQTMYWNSISSQFLCQNISLTISGDVTGAAGNVTVVKIQGTSVNPAPPTSGDILRFNGSEYIASPLPADAVVSVAGKIGVVTLTSADISGLTFGTTAGTFAQGNDSRMVNAVQTSTAFSGDVSGTVAANSVVKIRGTAVSASAPASGDVLRYNGTQYVPASIPADMVTSVAGRIGAVTLSSADISGLTFGSTVGTFAEGNDSRIVNAVQTSTAFSGDVSGTVAANSVVKIRGTAVSASAPASGDVLRYNGTQYVPASIPADLVTSVAGRIGAVTLSSSDISGLTFGTTAGTFAQGNDSRMVNAVQTSTSFSGDVSGTVAANSVVKIRGTNVSAAAPVSGDVLQYNGTQYVPVAIPSAPVSSVAGRTGAVVLSTSDISGFNSALQVTDFNGYVVSSSCTTSQSLYWNSVSSQFLCQNISFPVTTVAGRTGAVVLASSDVSGLGGAAGLNVGTAASTVAAGDDSRIVNALQTSSVFSGDVSGTSASVSVNKLRGVAMSATAPTAGQALVYDGTQWIPTTGFPSYAKKTGNQTFSSTTIASVTSLAFNVSAGATYKYKFNVMYTSAATTTGLKIGLTYPAVTSASALANIAAGVDGTGAYFQGVINTSGDSVVASATPAIAPAVMLAYIEGIIVPTAAGSVQLMAGSEVAASNIIILAGSFVEVVVVP